MGVFIFCVVASLLILNYRINKLEQETKDLKILQKINSRNLEYLCYLAPEPKEGQLTYDEYMKKQGYMKGEEDGRSNN